VSGLTLAVEIAFGLLFGATFITWLRRRDAVSMDVMLIFAALAGLFFVSAFSTSSNQGLAGALALALLFAQPVLTLRLVARIRRVRRSILLGAGLIWVLTAIPPIFISALVVWPLLLGGLVAFVVTDAAVAVYLWLEARNRVASAKVRLIAAAAGSALMAAAILISIFGSIITHSSTVSSEAGRATALVAALLFAGAFVAPQWMRRIGGAVTAGQFTGHLLSGPAGERPDEIWSRLTNLARRTTGAVTGFVVSGEPPTVAGLSGDLRARDALDADPLRAIPDAAEGNRRLNGTHDGLANAAAAVGASFATVMRFEVAGAPAALVLLRERPSIFVADDQALLARLIDLARIFAERAEALRQEATLTDRLSATVSALEHASQAKSDFLASMSHELRTPLSAIIGFSALMRDQPLEDGKRAIPDEWITHVRRSGDHLLSLINDVLDLTKIEAGRIDLAPEAFDLGTALAESVEGLRPLADKKSIDLKLDAAPGLIEADRGRLRQIVYNLLSNAIKFTPDGGKVAVQSRWDGTDAVIAVVDTGKGIAAEDIDHIFEEFRQVGDLKDRSAGTGLGLALSRRLAEAHQGSITVRSTFGTGSTFELRLPRGNVVDQPTVVALPGVSRPADAAVVLVIEDDPAAVRLLRAYLEEAGHVVEAAPDGESGIAAARRLNPDAIILDVLLPGIDGWEVMRRLKQDADTRDIPVVVATVVDERNVAMNLGAADYLLKPVHRDALLARLSSYTFTTKVKLHAVRALVIDDDPAARALVTQALEPEGFEVIAADSGRAGVALAGQMQPDLVICDLVMPGMDGFEVVQALAESDLPAQVPILILTSQQLSDADRERLNGRVAGIIQKSEDVRQNLDRWLSRASRLARRRREVDARPVVAASAASAASASELAAPRP
jgi:signal transduction histidine kinase/DNA-binding response OmpR family regulator